MSLCGIIGHSELECPNPTDRDAEGNMEYNNNIQAPEEKKKRIQSISQAAATSDWSGTSMRSESRSASKEKSSKEGSRQ